MTARFRNELLRAVRLELSMSQEDAARALGVDVRTYRRYESGAVNEGGPFSVRTAARRRLLHRMSAELGVAEADWVEHASPSPRRHALSRARHFVGRESALAALARWRDAGTPVLAIVGMGGAGKTALVERFLATHRETAYVHSFYDEPRSEPVVENLESATPAALVVLDGLEAAQSSGADGRAAGELVDPALRRALRAVAAGLVPTKVILTSRMPPSDLAEWEGTGVETLALAPLSDEESRDVLRAWGVAGDERSLSAVAARAAGHALCLAMLGSYTSAFLGGDARLAAEVSVDDAASDDPIARRLARVLASYASALRPRERAVLAHLSLFAGAADPDLLAAALDAPPAEIRASLARLVRLGLVAESAAGPAAHPFVREHFRRVVGAPEEAHAKVRDALEASLVGRPRREVDDAVLLDRYEALLHHTRASGRIREAFDLYEHALGGFANLGLRLGAMARGARVLARFADGGPERVHESIEGRARADLIYDWSLYAGALGDLALARRCYAAHGRAIEALPRSAAEPLLALNARAQAYVAWLAGDFARAAAALERSLSYDDVFHRVRGLALLAIVLHDAGDATGADRALAHLRAIEPRPVTRRALWVAEIHLDRGELDEARALAERAAVECAQRRWPGHVAHAATLLGRCHLHDLARARASLEEARRWIDRAGEVDVALRVHHLAGELAAATGDDEAAARERGLGRSLVGTHGFGRWARVFGA